MGLSRKVNGIVEVVLLKQRGNQFFITDISLDKHMARVAFYALEVFQVACIGLAIM